MENNIIDGKIDAVQELMIDLRKERSELKKKLDELSEVEVDYRHLLNPRISSLPADKIAVIVSEYRKTLAERTDIKISIEKLDKLLCSRVIDVSNYPAKISVLKKKVYGVRHIKDVFERYSKYIPGDVSYHGKNIKNNI